MTYWDVPDLTPEETHSLLMRWCDGESPTKLCVEYGIEAVAFCALVGRRGRVGATGAPGRDVVTCPAG